MQIKLAMYTNLEKNWTIKNNELQLYTNSKKNEVRNGDLRISKVSNQYLSTLLSFSFVLCTTPYRPGCLHDKPVLISYVPHKVNLKYSSIFDNHYIKKIVHLRTDPLRNSIFGMYIHWIIYIPHCLQPLGHQI